MDAGLRDHVHREVAGAQNAITYAVVRKTRLASPSAERVLALTARLLRNDAEIICVGCSICSLPWSIWFLSVAFS